MLFESANQGLVFLEIFFLSVLFSFFCELIFMFSKKAKKSIKIVLDFFKTVFYGIFFFFCSVWFCYGEIRLFVIITLLLGLMTANFLLKKTKKLIIKAKLKKLLKKEKM